MEDKTMEFKDFISYLLQGRGDPQYAKIHPDNIIEYCTNIGLMNLGVIGTQRDEKELLSMSLSFAAGIYSFLPQGCVLQAGPVILPISDKDLEAKVKPLEVFPDMPEWANGKVRVYYQAKTPEEFQKLREFFESVPEDSGQLPKKGANFFCYD